MKIKSLIFKTAGEEFFSVPEPDKWIRVDDSSYIREESCAEFLVSVEEDEAYMISEIKSGIKEIDKNIYNKYVSELREIFDYCLREYTRNIPRELPGNKEDKNE